MNNNRNGGGDAFKTRKRKMVEVEDDEVVGGRRWRSGVGTSPELRWGMGMSNDSRIVRVSRSSGGKDRHSKVLTAKGLRDRRVRLSVSTAIQFYDLQDRLGFDQPSKAVEWLIKAAAPAIDDLPQLGTFSNVLNTEHGPAVVFTETPSAANTSQSSREAQQGHCEGLKMMMMMRQEAESGLGKSSTSTNSNSGEEGTGDTSLSRSEWRLKARERARERERAKTNFQSCANAATAYCPVQNQQGDNDGVGARDTFTGLLNSVADVALEARESNHNSKYDPGKRPWAGLSVQPYPHALDHLSHDPPTVMPQQCCPAFVNAAIFTAKNTCQDHKHHTDHLSSHFTSNPSVLLLQQQQQQQHKTSFNVEEQQLVPINLSWPALSGRETLQSNSYNSIMAYYTQINHSVDQSSMRNAYRQGIFDGRLLQWPNPDFDAVQGSLKEDNKKIHQNHHS